MPTFISLDQVKDPKKYGEALKKGALAVKPDEPKNFYLLASFDFGKEKKPLLLIDYQANMLAALGRVTPKAKGEVVRNAKNELQFEKTGKGVCQELQTFLTKHLIQDTVHIPAEDGDGATPPAGATAAVNAPAKAASTPAPGKFPVPQKAGAPARVAAVTPKPAGPPAPATSGGTTPAHPATPVHLATPPVRTNSGPTPATPAKPQAASPASPNPTFKRAAIPNTPAGPATPTTPTRPAGTPPAAGGVGMARTRATPPPAGTAATPPHPTGPQPAAVPPTAPAPQAAATPHPAAGPQPAAAPHPAAGTQGAAAPHPAAGPQAAAAPHPAAATPGAAAAHSAAGTPAAAGTLDPAAVKAQREAALPGQIAKCKKQLEFLEKQAWPNVAPEKKKADLEALAADLNVADINDIGEIEGKVNGLLRLKLDPAAPRWPKIDGVKPFFLTPALRKDQVEKMCEELKALTSLVSSKNPDDAVIGEMQALETKVGSVSQGATACVDPAEMKKLFEEFKDLQKERQALGKKIRPMWIDDQKTRFNDEMEKARGAGKKSSSGSMILALGDEAFMEMARLSESMVEKANAAAKAANAKPPKPGEKPALKNENFNPYKANPNGGPAEPMEMGEVASIYGYSTQDFTSINAILRGSKVNPAEDKTPRTGAAGDDDENPNMDFRPYIEACKSALKKLPVFKGTVRRCDKSLPDVVIKELLTSGTRSDPAFVSTGLEAVPGFGEIVSIITDIKTGRDISMFSLHGTEGEVLFPPGSVFKFVKFVDREPVKGEKEKPKEITDIKKLTADQLKNLKKGVFYLTQKS